MLTVQDAEDMQHTNKKARIWSKTAVERDSHVLGNCDASSVLPADFVIPRDNPTRKAVPKKIRISFTSLRLLGLRGESRAMDSSAPLTQASVSSTAPSMLSFPAAISFAVTEGEQKQPSEVTLTLAKDAYFATAHPCVASTHVKIFQAPSSPTIREIDTSGQAAAAAGSSSVSNKAASSPVKSTGHPLHKVYTYAVVHLSELLAKRDCSLDDLLLDNAPASFTPTQHHKHPNFLVVDCITGFAPLPQDHEMPQSPLIDRSRGSLLSPVSVSTPLAGTPTTSTSTSTPRPGSASGNGLEQASRKMHWETRRRQFGSDAEILVRALCSQKGWNALISRRRRGCLACAIREAGALGWRVVIRVD
jgi:hypothetical protein